jgi:predicted RNase H-like HicB family nuclease
MRELIFEVAQESDGGFTAEALGEGIFTQADSWEELRANVQEAVEAYFFDQQKPSAVRLRLVRDEVMAIA